MIFWTVQFNLHRNAKIIRIEVELHNADLREAALELEEIMTLAEMVPENFQRGLTESASGGASQAETVLPVA